MFERLSRITAVALVSCVSVYAQSERGSIRGTIEDATGAVVPGARVTATNVGTGVETSTRSTESGN